ncbi:MAG: DUF1311 domain-containing protein [Rhizobiaceae bacterium]|nr:DUF1311 domain-containing protein [Rhizobiaceae bacterium]
MAIVPLHCAPGFAQDDLALNIRHTQECLAEKNDDERQTCVGKSANVCMQSDPGNSTVGMGFCLDEELRWWDARLNRVYSSYLASEKRDDQELKNIGSSAPEKAPALKEMQRSWIKYRDALCEHEAVQWGGGTGQGPAYLSCLLSETGRQIFVLEDRMNGWNQ